MARFDDFKQQERRVIREAMIGAQSEFYDPGHTKEERDTLEALIREIEDRDLPFTFGEEPAVPASKRYRNLDQAMASMPDVIRENDGFLPSLAELEARQRREAETAQEPPRDARQGVPERREAYTPTRPPRPPSWPAGPATAGKGETGFLIIQCAHCGDVHAFCARQPIENYRCDKCGGRTPLTDMFPLRVMCECGSKYSYRTNIVTKQMDVNCYKCGCPVAVEWSDRRGRYEPIGWGERKKRKGRRK